MHIIDIHTHGIAGYDTRQATAKDILRIAEIHGAYGSDAIIPTIYSAPIDRMRSDIEAVEKAMELQAAKQKSSKFDVQGSMSENDSQTDESKSDKTKAKNIEHRTLNIERRPRSDIPPAAILGVHLEGPFLNQASAGSLDKTSFLPAKASSLEELLEGLSNTVKIITVAPELDGAPGFIRSITDMGIIVNMGHSDATYNEAEAGFNAGAKGITHLFNGMRGIHHREPGIAGFGLANPHVYVEVIADPFHLHVGAIGLIFAAKKPDKIIIISDSIRESLMDDTTGKITDSTGRLLGGSMTIAGSVEYLIGLGFNKDIVMRCISENPARYLTMERRVPSDSGPRFSSGLQAL